MREIRVPDIGDFEDVEVIEVLVKPGDAVRREQSLVTLESDKATMEIPSPEAGVVKELRIKVGDKVSEGSPILLLEEVPAGTEQENASPAPVPATVPQEPAPAPPAPAPGTPSAGLPAMRPSAPVPREPAEAVHAKPHASPSVRRFARELGVDLAQVRGSGPKGRILHTDVQAWVKAVVRGRTESAAAGPARGIGLDIAPWPEVDFAKFGPVETKPLSRIRRLSGANLHRNWVTIPHVTQHEEADITELEAFRRSNSAETEKRGFKLTLLAFLIKASVAALREFPEFNASLDRSGENLVLKKYYHIGVAVDTPEGLVVPVLRDADRKGVFELARELAEISKLARERKLSPGDLQGGTFSISSLGGIGGSAFTPIVHAPEVAILGVSRAVTRPVWNAEAKSFVPRLMLPLSLSYDHRVIDGAQAARFAAFLAGVLSDIRRTLL